MNTRPIVLITGASKGIGAAIAEKLAESGYDIWLNYRSDHQGAEKKQEILEKKGITCTLLPFDVANAQAVSNALEPLLAKDVPYGLIHNAGITRDGLAAMMSKKDWDDVIEVHLSGFFYVVKPVLRAMLRKRRGRIIAISSVSGEMGQAGQFNYSAAKAGLIGAVKALAKEVARRNILVNVVSPGLIETEMIKDLPKDKLLPLIPLNRFGRPEEVAGVVKFLLGEDATYITGQVISVNGGLYM